MFVFTVCIKIRLKLISENLNLIQKSSIRDY